ncbi:MAG: glycosyl hydrolase family 28-related protein [Kiritimatiellia bacterium]
MNINLITSVLSITASIFTFPFALGAEYPRDMRVVDLSQPPYNADSTGQTDATASIQKALDDHHLGDNWILYLPDGTYRISDTLDWGNGARMGPVLQGQSRDGTVLKVKDQCDGFGDGLDPKPVITIATRGSADAFCMAVRNLTVNTGRQNPGAIALQFMANNQGAVRDVLLVSGDGAGVIGLDMAFTDMIGPLLVKNLEVRGFDVGVAMANEVASMTFEHIRLTGQKEVGLRNAGQCVSIRGLVSENTVTAVENLGPQSLMVLIDSRLKGMGDAAGVPAIRNSGSCYLRDIATPGYRHPLETTTGRYTEVDPARIDEFISGPVLSLFPSLHHSLDLPIKETPEIPWGDVSTWANVESFGADSRDKEDDTEAIQRAIDSGAETIYFPHPLPAGREKTNLPRGSYRIDGTVRIRGNVRRLIGGGGSWTMIRVGGSTRDAAFLIEDGAAPEVIFEDFNFVDAVKAGELCPLITHRSKRTLVLRHINSIMHNSLYRGEPQAGTVFFEDVSSQFPMGGRNRAGDTPHFYFAPGQKAWARQLNPETDATKIVNDGADLWILGLKTEVKSTVLENRNGGRTEILGGLNYPSLPGEGDQTMFRLVDGSFTAVMGEAGFSRRFDVLVEEHRLGETKVLGRDQAPSRSGGSMLPLYTAHWQASNEKPQPPTDLALTSTDPRATQLSWQGAKANDPALGEYVVYRDGVEIGRTRHTTFADSGLQDSTTYGYRVQALNPASQPAGEVIGSIATRTDDTPPALVRAAFQKYPPSVLLEFSEPVEASIVNHPEFFEVFPARQIRAVSFGQSAGEVQLHLDDQQGLPDEVSIRGIRDRAKTPNTLEPVTASVDIPIQPKPLLNLNFTSMEPGRIPSGVVDDSAWKSAKADITLAAEGDDGTALKVVVDPFAQVILGQVPVERGQMYRVVANIRASKPDQRVRLQVRQKEKPFMSHGAVGQSVGVTPTSVQFEFKGSAGDPSARLYLVLSGQTTLWIDRVLVLAMPTPEQLAAPGDRTPPKIEMAQLMEYPRRIEVKFDEPVDTASSTAANYELSPDAPIENIFSEMDSDVVVLLLDPAADPPGRITVRNISDMAPRPNVLDEASIEITKGPLPKVLHEETFDDVAPGKLPSGVRDDSAWKKAKADLQVRGGDGNGWLAIGVNGFAQVDLQRVALKQGHRYRVLGRLATEDTPHDVTLMVRQFTAPFHTYGAAKIRVTGDNTSRVLLDFEAAATDGNARLYLITNADASLRLDDLIIVEKPAVP